MKEHGIFIAAVEHSSFAGDASSGAMGSYDLTGGHGFSARTIIRAPSGWTNTSGTIWQRPSDAPSNRTPSMSVTYCTPYHLVRNTPHHRPQINQGREFGVSGGVLYINVNSAIKPKRAIRHLRMDRCFAQILLIEDCESYGNFSDSRLAPDHEGHGFVFDDCSDDSVFRRNLIVWQSGTGFRLSSRAIGNQI